MSMSSTMVIKVTELETLQSAQSCACAGLKQSLLDRTHRMIWSCQCDNPRRWRRSKRVERRERPRRPRDSPRRRVELIPASADRPVLRCSLSSGKPWRDRSKLRPAPLTTNQARSEYKHSLTFRVRRYVVIATKPVHRGTIANPPNNAQLGIPPTIPQVISGSVQ